MSKDKDQYSDNSYVPQLKQWTWRRALNSVENKTCGLGEHKEVIASMQKSRSEKDKKLLHVLTTITEEDYDHATDTPTDPYEVDGDNLSETHSYGKVNSGDVDAGDEDVIRTECDKLDVMDKSDEKGESHELVMDAE